MLKLTALLSVAAIAAACVQIVDPTKNTETPLTMPQGWDDRTRTLFSHTPQGSRMMRNAWFRALEAPDGAGLFSDAGNLAQYGLIASGKSPLNPDGYPVGFALDPGPDATREVGLTCAACHTAIVTVKGRPIRIDGAPAHLDFDRFYADLNRAVGATAFDKARFMRFAGKVLEAPDQAAIGALQQEFASFQRKLSSDATMRRATVAPGFGRVDALTQIINSLAARDQNEVSNIAPVGAPTSYPPLWLTPDLEFVQWNPIAANPMGRNGGEALGVFGAVNLNPAAGAPFDSTILPKQLHALESWVAGLSPPAWDAKIMGPINAARAAQGAAIFKDKCAACHNMAPYRRTDPAKNFFGKDFVAIGRVNYLKVGTDPAYMQAMLARTIKTNAVTAPLFGGRAEVPAAEFFVRTVGAAVGASMQKAGLSQSEQIVLSGHRFTKGADGKPVGYQPRGFTDLKAGPLAGVWATGPYLHNGSVPTVYELLSPENQRRQTFWTGGRELDLTRLGFVSDEAPGLFRFDASLPGNRAVGHNYPKGGLTHRQRMAVIEYLKTQ